MKVPSTVVWQLTKKWNSNLVTFNHQQFTRDPLSLTNLHNASQAGLSNDRAIGLQVRKEKAKKGQRRVISLLQTHKTHNKISKKKKNSQSGLLYSKNELKRGLNRVARIVKNVPTLTDRVRRLALRRLQRIHVASRQTVKGVAKKTEAKK